MQNKNKKVGFFVFWFFLSCSPTDIQQEKIPFTCLSDLQLVILEELSVFPFSHGYINSCMVCTTQKRTTFKPDSCPCQKFAAEELCKKMVNPGHPHSGNPQQLL